MKFSMPALSDKHFADYTQLDTLLPLRAWQVLRACALLATLALVGWLLASPVIGLEVVWGLIVPVLPLVFFIAPGLWRNLCPFATSNQIPRLFGFSRGLTQKALSEGAAYPLGIALFFILVIGRKLIFNTSGIATAALILGAILCAFVGGFFFKGKSGWCGSLCPVLPVQRIYGQTPFVNIANTHCQPCVGCAKNCHDFAPGAAYLTDQYDANARYAGYRRFFAGVFPGFVLSYYLVVTPPVISVGEMLTQTLFYMAASLALFHTLETLVKATRNSMPVIFAAAAINIYYWFATKTVVATLALLGVPMAEAWVWGVRALVFGASVWWIVRSLQAEHRFLAQLLEQAACGVTQLSTTAQNTIAEFAHLFRNGASMGAQLEAATSAACGQGAPAAREVAVRIDPKGKNVTIRSGLSVLDAVESGGVAIESGCRMGVCGADPIAITNGMENLSHIGGSERSTLERLGFAQNTRMACSARVRGPVVMELKPHRKVAAVIKEVQDYDSAIKSVVIVGNGIAGLTAAQHVRRRHPQCEIHVIGREKHHPYNRMNVPRLIYGRSGMQGLYLNSESWYDEQRITCWLNTHVLALDPATQHLQLATGEAVGYDRLILATGSSSYMPAIKGFGVDGTFALRDADEAMGLREFIQHHRAKKVVIAGAGLLGLEAAYALHKLGIHVTVLANANWVMNRQLDARAGEMVRRYFGKIGIEICTQAVAVNIHKNRAKCLTRVDLEDGRTLPCDALMVCAGVRPNVDLARDAGITVQRGIVVGDRMQTNVAHIYAAGDVAEFGGETYGLWPVAVEQGEIAAINSMGGDRRYAGYVPSTLLKVVGIDLMSAGRFEAGSEGIEIVREDNEAPRYCKLVIEEGRLVGAILLGYPVEAAMVLKLVRSHVDVSRVVDSLRAGNLECLGALDIEAA